MNLAKQGDTDVWGDDLLDRSKDAVFLYNFVLGQVAKRKSQGRSGSYVLNIDADWGAGKTFFLERFAANVRNLGHLVVEINAWRDDHAQDPYVAIMAAIDKTFAPYIKKQTKLGNAWKVAKRSGGAIALKASGAIAKGLLKKYAGTSLDDLAEAIDGDTLLGDSVETAVQDGVGEAGKQLEKLFDASVDVLIDSFNRADAAIADFREKLGAAIQSISGEKKSPLFIVVDELDRCRPTYAVQLLERVKHLFDVQDVVFIFGTNADQLQHSISGAYGPSFDGYRYLKRFFDRTYVFDKPSIEAFVESHRRMLPEGKIRSAGADLLDVLVSGCRAYNFDLRAISQIMEMIDATASAWRHKQPIEIALLFPICAYFYQTGKAQWDIASPSPLDSWVLKRYEFDRYSSRYIDKSIQFGPIYRESVDLFDSLSKIMKRNERGSSSESDDYLREIFVPEWSGVLIERDSSSIQTELLGLVANAGKMLDS